MPGYVDPKLAAGMGAQVKRLRGERGWSLRALAQKSSLSFSYVRRIENGQSASAAAYDKLARAFGVTFVVGGSRPSSLHPPAALRDHSPDLGVRRNGRRSLRKSTQGRSQ